MPAPTYNYPGSTLVRLVDADTFIADVRCGLDFGFHITVAAMARQRFRVAGVNCAPSSTEQGGAATAFVLPLLQAGPFAVKSLGPYKYGDEWMADVTLFDGRNLTQLLIAEQWAAPWDGQGKQPLPPWPRTVPAV